MNSRTASVVLHAPKEDVFSYPSKTENLILLPRAGGRLQISRYDYIRPSSNECKN